MEIFRMWGRVFIKDEASQALDNLDNRAKKTQTGFSKLASTVGKGIGAFLAATAAVAGTIATVKSLTEATMAQERAEQRLQQLMSNVPGTTQEQIEAIKALAREQQKLTTIGDEVAISGASQLATFQLQADSIAKLMPAMNDLAVAAYGVNVSQEQMINIANLMGKAMMGQVGALTRYGVSLTETQAELLKTGDEQQRVAVLNEVLAQNFGGLAQSMAQTTEGSIVQMKNAWGDMKEVLGGMLLPVLEKLAKWITDHMPQIQAVFMIAFKNIKMHISLVWTVIDTLLLPVLRTLWDWIGPHMPKIQASVETAFKAIEVVIHGVADTFGFLINMIQKAINWLDRFNNKEVKRKTVQVSTSETFETEEKRNMRISTEGIPMMAEGGTITRSGWAIVGERGPELLNLPRGAQVRPLNKPSIVVNINNPKVFDTHDADRLGELLVSRLRMLGVTP